MAHPGAEVAAAWLGCWAAAVRDRRAWLTELDAAIGDGDHGINLDRGLAAVRADIGDGPGPGDDGGAVLTSAGRRLIGLVGGASGALYGRAFVRAGEAVADEGDPCRLGELALAAAIDAISGLGKAVAGDKTMLDALVPALEALRSAPAGLAAAGRLASAAEAAEAGALASIPLVARKGRASYLGERSSGHMDPGAASSAMLVRCLSRIVVRD